MSENKFVKNSIKFFEKLNNNFIRNPIVFDEISSTNEKAKKLAILGKDEGTIVLARIQKQGRGRFDRVWESPNGGVYISIILRPNCPPVKSMLISLLSAIIISRTISDFNISPTIKWPNDVRIGEKKIAGVLIESESYQNQLKYVVVGIGINAAVKIQDLSNNIRETSTSLSKEIGKEVDYYEFLEKFLGYFKNYYNKFLNEEYDKILDEWKNLSNTIGQKVIINPDGNPITGMVSDITKSGYLIVKINKNQYITISSGEIIYL